MKINQFEIWIADLNPRFGTETGKVRPIVILQTNLLNSIHPSSLICPLTTKIQSKTEILRINLPKGIANNKDECDLMMDQIRAIDNRRLKRKIGKVPSEIQNRIKSSIIVLFDLFDF